MKPLALPHCRRASYPANLPAARFASSIQTEDAAGCAIAILGLPDDLGVRLNNGRPGARKGPEAFRAALACYGIGAPNECDLPRVFDAGDVEPVAGDDATALSKTHDRVSDAAETLSRAGLLVVGIGGGHDLTYPLVRGVFRARGRLPLPGVYFDAHLDVRETVGSGMAFRKLMEEQIASSLRIAGYNPLVNHRDHTDWFLDHFGTIAPADSDPLGGLATSGSFVSVDLDVIDMSAAPGVSAPNPAGMMPAMLSEHLRRLGTHFDLACIDFMELNPVHDDGDRTARVAAHLFLNFLFGVGLRKQRIRTP
ncbi:MAG: arginase family protein [Phycisphaerales bacterium]|nr:arginase family protein [Planctomycetota bacterium]